MHIVRVCRKLSAVVQNVCKIEREREKDRERKKILEVFPESKRVRLLWLEFWHFSSCFSSFSFYVSAFNPLFFQRRH